MSTYTPQFQLSALENVVGLINQQNNTGFALADMNVKPLVVLDQPSANGGDTQIEIDLTKAPSEVDGDWVAFQYKRMSLTEIFSLVTAAGKNVFREVDVAIGEDGLPEDQAAFFAEILRKYNFALTAEDFTLSLKSKGIIEITAKPENYAYTGSFEMGIFDSLATRVGKKVLAGFTAALTTPHVPEPAPTV